MALSGARLAGLEVVLGAVASPASLGSPGAGSPSQPRSRRSSWQGDDPGLRRPPPGVLPSPTGGPGLPLPRRRAGPRVRRGSTGEVRAEASSEALVAPQRDSPAAAGVSRREFVARQEEEGERAAQSILDGVDEQLPVRTGLSMVVGVYVCPHPDKVEKGGEDAYFVSGTGGGVIGVADGVSGVAEDGIDPALYSRELMQHAEAAAAALPGCVADPRCVLEAAHADVAAQGACTAVVAALEAGSGKLRVANLGDSGLRVLRGGRICFATPVLQHFFDCPFQFGSESTDSTADAEAFEVQLKAGDTLVMGSDGLFDNMFDRDIEAVACLFNDAPDAATTTAMALANLAKKHSLDAEYESPYILEAIKEGYDVPFWKKMLGQKLTGGKQDDITVVVANIVAAPAAPGTHHPDAIATAPQQGAPAADAEAASAEPQEAAGAGAAREAPPHGAQVAEAV